MSGTTTNQDRVVAAKATGKIMVLSRPKMGSDPITTL